MKTALLDSRDWKAILDEINSNGYALLKTQVTDLWILELLAQKLGEIRGGSFWQGYYDIKYDPSMPQVQGSTALSASDFPFHTDGSFEINPPRFFILQCIISDLEGYGKLVLIDGNDVLQNLPSEMLEVLTSVEFSYTRREGDIEVTSAGTIISKMGDTYQFRYRNDHNFVIIGQSKSSVELLAKFNEVLRSKQLHKEIFLRPGDIVIVDNFRCLHGRTELSGKSHRLHRRIWVDR